MRKTVRNPRCRTLLISLAASLLAAACSGAASEESETARLDLQGLDGGAASIDAGVSSASHDGGAGLDAGCAALPPLRLTRVTQLEQTATLLVQAPADPRMFLAERLGRILVLRDGAVSPQPFLDLRSSVAPPETERGLLSLALHPDFARNGRFYVVYTRAADDPQTPALHTLGDLVLAEGTASRADPDRADPTLKVLRTVPKAVRYHNGGMAAFGPDGLLYLSTGEDGRVYDPALRPTLQELTNGLGKILRIDVDHPEARPPGNVETGDVHVWAYGLRNPWRWSFDRLTGDMYVGDVGENSWEEINFAPRGVGIRNYGWPLMEGSRCSAYVPDCDQTGITLPVFEYPHDGPGAVDGVCDFDDEQLIECNHAVLGGYVYRGSALPELHGRYFFGDNIHNEVRSLVVDEGRATCLADHTAALTTRATPLRGLISFSEDAQGELYLLDIFGNVYRLDRG